MRRLMGMLLNNLGLAVTEAENGAQAIEIADKERFDLVLTDLEMPLKNGLELCRSIRQSALNPFTPVMIVTGNFDADLKGAAKAAGVTGILHKPLDTKKFIKAICIYAKIEPPA